MHGDILSHGKHYKLNADGSLGPEIHAYLSNANRFALEAAADGGRGSRSVSVAAVNIHGASGSRSGGSDTIVDKLKRDMTALGFESGWRENCNEQPSLAGRPLRCNLCREPNGSRNL
jgi:hypothetical protein